MPLLTAMRSARTASAVVRSKRRRRAEQKHGPLAPIAMFAIRIGGGLDGIGCQNIGGTVSTSDVIPAISSAAKVETGSVTSVFPGGLSRRRSRVRAPSLAPLSQTTEASSSLAIWWLGKRLLCRWLASDRIRNFAGAVTYARNLCNAAEVTCLLGAKRNPALAGLFAICHERKGRRAVLGRLSWCSV